MRAGRFDPQTQVFEFNHVPKCGGTTLHDVLGRLMDGQNPIAHRPKNIVRMIVLREPLQRILSFHGKR